MKQHGQRCPNEVLKVNLIDKLKITGGHSKQIRKRRIRTLIRHVKKLEAELLAHADEETSANEDEDEEEYNEDFENLYV